MPLPPIYPIDSLYAMRRATYSGGNQSSHCWSERKVQYV
ncbi:hypothetical protein E2C01_079119 [Portunus trituberculatus]|uniref:Uncharacterized protein n=1 Tax=Portunus trituberculatus TaxID=210409 RepID=A0A5B7IG55_PORTR|nr:hypothetical protein [Portunus trituberculatus]